MGVGVALKSSWEESAWMGWMSKCHQEGRTYVYVSFTLRWLASSKTVPSKIVFTYIIATFSTLSATRGEEIMLLYLGKINSASLDVPQILFSIAHYTLCYKWTLRRYKGKVTGNIWRCVDTLMDILLCQKL